MDETIECLIRYKGKKGVFYDRYNEQMEELGFSYIDTIHLSGLGLELLKYAYNGNDFQKDRQYALSIDENIEMVVNKEYYAFHEDDEHLA